MRFFLYQLLAVTLILFTTFTGGTVNPRLTHESQ
jgi:hypothetical protein